MDDKNDKLIHSHCISYGSNKEHGTKQNQAMLLRNALLRDDLNDNNFDVGVKQRPE